MVYRLFSPRTLFKVKNDRSGTNLTNYCGRSISLGRCRVLNGSFISLSVHFDTIYRNHATNLTKSQFYYTQYVNVNPYGHPL
jgi:hypothetical protein